ncbi:MAG: ATPase [Alphaproteobacteria bacterium]|jgi:uncharacterized protein|nr:ATPase [Alphaproteobacteria bacterium]MBT5828128.1 ATPase [Alphaproteobacteria bacterium]
MSSCAYKKNDFFFFSLVFVTLFSYILSFFIELTFLLSVKEFLHIVWPALILGMLFVSILHYIPNHYIYRLFGHGGVFGIFRASFAGILLDLCSHGILMVANKLYKKGLSNGQIIAFLIASPWNSLSLSFILISLIGLKWTILFIIFSFIIAFVTGCIFDILTNFGYLNQNPYSINNIVDEDKKIEQFNFFKAIKVALIEARILVKWLFLGILLISLMREFIDPSTFSAAFAPTLKGLFFTVFIASIIEVCSEGSTPIASDIFNYSNAKGNSFAFLMAGAATDYTEIMLLKETTKSWRFALFIPLISLPQIILISYFFNLA